MQGVIGKNSFVFFLWSQAARCRRRCRRSPARRCTPPPSFAVDKGLDLFLSPVLVLSLAPARSLSLYRAHARNPSFAPPPWPPIRRRSELPRAPLRCRGAPPCPPLRLGQVNRAMVPRVVGIEPFLPGVRRRCPPSKPSLRRPFGGGAATKWLPSVSSSERAHPRLQVSPRSSNPSTTPSASPLLTSC